MLRLVDADHKLYAQKALLTSLRTARTRGISLVAAAIVDLRRFALFHYEEPDMVALGLHSPREYQPEPLFRQALLIDETFQRDDLEKLLGKRRYDGVDPKTPAAAVAEAVAGLRGTLDDIYKAQRHLDVDLPLPQGDGVDPLPLAELPALSLEESQALTDSG